MPKNSKQKIEKHYFEMFREAYSLPSGEIEFGDKPDVIINGPKKIGIEMTNFYLKDGSSSKSEQKQQLLREAVVNSAQELYLKNGGKSITISFDFDKEKPIENKKKLVKKLVEYVKSIEDQEEGSMFMETFKEIPELSFVYLQKGLYLDGRWRIVASSRGQTMSRDRLLEVVKAKEKLVEQYRECESYWLLIVVEFMDRAQDQEILIRDFNKIGSEKFEKVFVYRTAMKHILEVK
jgi:uncharacterized protein YxeA